MHIRVLLMLYLTWIFYIYYIKICGIRDTYSWLLLPIECKFICDVLKSSLYKHSKIVNYLSDKFPTGKCSSVCFWITLMKIYPSIGLWLHSDTSICYCDWWCRCSQKAKKRLIFFSHNKYISYNILYYRDTNRKIRKTEFIYICGSQNG